MVDLTSALLLMAREQRPDEAAEWSSDVCEVVREVVNTHRYLVSPQTIVELSCQSRPHLAVERTLLAIVVGNLIRNAFSYTKSGKVTIFLEEGCLSVVDTGPGVPEAEIGKVFQRHFRGSASTGAGIGLSLVKRICDRYGWETIIDSAEGRGTTVQLLFSRSGDNPRS